MPGDRYFAVRDRLAELLGWIDGLAAEAALEPDLETEPPRPELHRPILIAAVGEINSGKSSVLNALAGEDLCEQGPLPLTVDVRLHRYGAVPAEREVQPLLIEQRHRLDFLRDFELLDTPGTNARVEGHMEVSAPFLEHADLVMGVFSAENPWVAATWDALSRLSNEALGRTVLVVQKIDLKEKQDIPIILGHMRDLSLKRLGITLPIFPVSSRIAMEVKRSEKPDPKLWAQSRFSDLEHYISERICESYDRRQVLHDAWHHAARTLRRLDHRFETRRRGLEDDSWFLSTLEREMDERRDTALDAAPQAVTDVMERYRAEVDRVVTSLSGRLGWWPTLRRLFLGDGTAAEIETSFASRMQETAVGFGRDDAARHIDGCAAHWDTLRPRVLDRMGVEAGECAVAGEAREAVIGRFVSRLERAVPRALTALRLRGVLDPHLRRRNSALKGLVTLGLILAMAAGIAGSLGWQEPAVWIVIGAVAVVLLSVVTSWITRARVVTAYEERLLAGTATFADGLKVDHGEGIRSLYRDHSLSLVEVSRQLAGAKASLHPQMERANSLYISLKSIELDL